MPSPLKNIPEPAAAAPVGVGSAIPKQARGKLGKMIDIGDASFIEFYLPQSLAGQTEIDSEQSPWMNRNAVIQFWNLTTDRLDMQIEFVSLLNAALDVKLPFNWLRSRAYASYLGPRIVRPPSTFSLICTGLVPLISLWEFAPGTLSWRTEGNAGTNGAIVPPKITVNFTLVRVDTKANKTNVRLG